MDRWFNLYLISCTGIVCYMPIYHFVMSLFCDSLFYFLGLMYFYAVCVFKVKIQIRMQCQPLPETQFSHVIEENYYEERLFWFELDREQTNKLISLFSSSQVIVSTFCPKEDTEVELTKQ